MDKFYHSVRLDPELCKGCINCIKRCPTQAIRVRNRKAQINSKFCIDCGECIRVCPHHAKLALYDPLDSLQHYDYTVALPAPSLYSQFNNLDDVNIVLNGLILMGFDDVFEVSAAAEMVSEATREYIAANYSGTPFISTACPSVVRLIRVKFPNLISNLLPLKPPIEVDFDKLKSVNEDVVGWIYVDALPDISYPIVKGKDNQTYLHQTYEKNYNFAGTIFVDYENSGDFSDCNTLVYGHNMKNGSMFGHLKKFREDDRLYKQDKYFWILTPERNYRYEIISAYTTGVNSDTYTLFKGPGEEFEKYLETIKGYSEIQTDDTDLTIKDKIVTLSTCTGNESTRFVVQGKRVDAEDADGAAANTGSTADEENTDEISLDIAG